ncbi:Ig-like domain-containing protein [Flavobacterium limnosediminis]|uniref:Ig-like domain-containing protein n=1 Tax=Flavobacterium limnosediminis TaxID=1401027 RepID=UPI00138B13BA|nr:T9SS type A sorting domain-containing protein [Flavobacterium limnosediminis]
MVSFFGYAQAGAIDLSFNPNDPGFGMGDGPNHYTTTTILQPDGKIIIGGNFTQYNSTARNRIARLNTDGSLDNTFNSVFPANDYINSIALQPDGKIIIVGNFTPVRIARLNNDGSIDSSFNPGFGANNSISSATLQPDGKIIIGGNFTSYNGTTRNRIARLNADGSLDSSFNPGTGTDNQVTSITLQPNGKIIIGGSFRSYNGTTKNFIARLNADATLDNTFNPGTGADSIVWSTTLQPDGKIIIIGYFSSYNNTPRYSIARLNADGTLDNSFNSGGLVDGQILTATLQPDGKIIIGGNFAFYGGTSNIARLNPDGSPDTTFDPGVGANNNIMSSILQPDGKVILTGYFTGYNATLRNYMVRLDSNGSVDNTFNPGSGANKNVYSIAIQSDSKIIIAGEFQSYNNVLLTRIARVNSDGSLDNTFNPGMGANNSILKAILQPDGKIVIVGLFTSYNGTARRYIARLNSNGTLDNTFDPGPGPNSPITSISLQPDGKMIISGGLNGYIGAIARLNNDGSVDTSFNSGTEANNTITSASLQPDGKIIISGLFTSYNNTICNHIARLNSDGSLDTTFNSGTGTDATLINILQPDGKIIIAGNFTSYNNTACNRIARLNTDGSLDTSFNTGSGVNNNIGIIVLQPDGKTIIFGPFTSYNGTTINQIARLNNDGSLDATFNAGTGVDTSINSAALQPDGKIIIGGAFKSYNNTGRNRITRIHGTASGITTAPITISGTTTINSGESTTLTQVGGSLGEGATYKWYTGSCGGTLVGTGASLTVSPTVTTTYYVLAEGPNNTTGCVSITVTVTTLGTAHPVYTIDNTVVIPNPYSEHFALDIPTLNQETITVKVYDSIGRLLEQRELKPIEKDKLQMGNGYPSGVYTILITQGKERKTLKVIKK